MNTTRIKYSSIFFKSLLCFCFVFFAAHVAVGQEDDEIPESIRLLVESIIEASGGEGDDFGFNTIAEQFQIYAKRPLNLNKASIEELEDFFLLDDAQIAGLVSYRNEFGDLLGIEELQAVPSFDLNTIRTILPYVKVGGDVDDYNISFKELVLGGQNELFVSWRRTLEEKRGYDPNEYEDPYLGKPWRLYTRFQRKYEDRLSVGFTAENDAGEEFFTGSNKQGFDYYSGHIYLNRYSRFLKTLALGDYQIGLGQGLIAKAGFGYGKSTEVMDVKRSGQTLRAQRSANEFDFFRGAGVTLGFGDNTEFSAFYSLRNRDANLLEQRDTLSGEIPAAAEFSSFQQSGLHRYKAEIDDENAVKVQSMGGNLKQRFKSGHIGLNAIYHTFDKDLTRTLQPYSQFDFNANKLLNASLDYGYIYKNFNFFGEIAWSDNNAIATLNGLLISLDRKVNLSIVHRHYPVDFHSLNARPFGETTGSGGRNEDGVYFGVAINPNKSWKIQAYYDFWKHPWLRSSIDIPSTGNEVFAQVNYIIKRKLDVYLRFRAENKLRNVRATNKNVLYDQNRMALRLHIGNKVTKALELRNRFEAIRFTLSSPIYDVPLITISDGEAIISDEPGRVSYGFMMYQDIVYKPIGIPWSFTARVALFDTEDYNSRIYAYENDLLYSFYIPPYYYRGTRAYLNLRYKGIRNLTLEGRIARTRLSGRKDIVNFEKFGSGREEISGKTRTDIKFQMKWNF